MKELPLTLLPNDVHAVASSGGKAHALWRLRKEGFRVPPWFVLTPNAFENGTLRSEAMQEIEQCLDRLSIRDKPLAVRSSSIEEDSEGASFAGQFESYLGVAAEDLTENIVNVWKSGYADRVSHYKTAMGEKEGFRPPAILVQEMVAADAAGVAFSVDPVKASWDHAVVSAIPGLGSTLVDGETDADSFVVDRQSRVAEKSLGDKRKARFLDTDAGFVVKEIELDLQLASKMSITDEQAVEIAALARGCERFFGRPQDIEWAFSGNELYLLQSRPVTTLSNVADPSGRMLLWDNSNIAESYSGITLPLTFSFARYIYTEVYRQFCVLLKVSSKNVEYNKEVFGQMLGLIRGRVYYNLLSWYKVLALLPGYSFNKTFMEQMMGVKEAISPEAQKEVDAVKKGSKWVDGFNLAMSLFGLLYKHVTIERDVRRFYERLDEALAELPKPFEAMRIEELAVHFHNLERRLLLKWDAPLVNDFIAMVFFGLLHRFCEKWIEGENTSLHNELLSDMGSIISAEPAKRIRKMASFAVEDVDLMNALRAGSKAEIEERAQRNPTFSAELKSYLATFGDRCLNELKLESETLLDDPLPLYRSIGGLAVRMKEGERGDAKCDTPEDSMQARAENAAKIALKGSPWKRMVFFYVLKHARRRIQGRENLRFERTRLFGRVRRLFLEIGKRLYAFNRIDDCKDIFYLEVDEIVHYIEGASTTQDLRALVALRKSEYERYALEETPSDRFETRGAPPIANRYRQEAAAGVRLEETEDGGLRGIACCSGVVRGRARVVTDPRREELKNGEILVAKQTDPGWIMLFPLASGLLVERGSMLSHSAIVSRELGLPSIVSIKGLMDTIKTGDEIEMDGSTGCIRILARAAESSGAEQAGAASDEITEEMR